MFKIIGYIVVGGFALYGFGKFLEWTDKPSAANRHEAGPKDKAPNKPESDQSQEVPAGPEAQSTAAWVD